MNDKPQELQDKLKAIERMQWEEITAKLNLKIESLERYVRDGKDHTSTISRHVSIIRALIWQAEGSMVRKEWGPVRDDILERLSDMDKMTRDIFDSFSHSSS